MTNEKEKVSERFEDFLNRMNPRLRRTMALYRIPVDDVEDVLHITLVALWRQFDSVRDPDRWLIGALKRQCLMYWRKRRRRLDSAVEDSLLEWLSEPVSPPQERAALIYDLRCLMGQLPQRCRSILELKFQGYDPAEVASRLGYQESSINKVTTRCLSALTRALVTADPEALPCVHLGRCAHLRSHRRK